MLAQGVIHRGDDLVGGAGGRVVVEVDHPGQWYVNTSESGGSAHRFNKQPPRLCFRGG